jgi:hypothetical protein
MMVSEGLMRAIEAAGRIASIDFGDFVAFGSCETKT